MVIFIKRHHQLLNNDNMIRNLTASNNFAIDDIILRPRPKIPSTMTAYRIEITLRQVRNFC